MENGEAGLVLANRLDTIFVLGYVGALIYTAV